MNPPRAATFISEPLEPDGESFDADRMAAGEPGLPQKFRWRGQELVMVKVLSPGKEHGDCNTAAASAPCAGTPTGCEPADGAITRIYFPRSFGRASSRAASRWWLHRIEDGAPRSTG